MAFGDNPIDPALKTAWSQFCNQLEQAGEQIFKDHNPTTESHRVDALRFLTQNLGQAFDLALETRDTQFPALHAFCHPTRKLGGDAADFSYHQAWIDGQSCYRIVGHRGNARFINFTLQGQRPDKQPGTDIPSLHDPFGDIPESNLFGHQLQVEADGSFELFIGGEQRGTNWMPTTEQTRKLFLRQGYDHWDEQPARLVIERLDMHSPKPLPSANDMIRATEWAGNFVSALMQDWPDHPYHYSPFVDPINVNSFPAGGADVEDKKRGRAVAHMCWQLAADEALIIEFDALDSFWMIANMGVFFNSMDYCYRPVSYTPSRTHINHDGKVRLILSHTDPGYHNWMDTQGFLRGNMTYRNLLSDSATEFKTQLVKFKDLQDALPADTKSITETERHQHLLQRFHAIRRRYPC